VDCTGYGKGKVMAEILCKRCGKTGESSQNVAYGGPLGEEIKSKVCNNCWNEWLGQSVKIINELRLNLRDTYSRDMLKKYMKEFLNLQETAPPH
jgi:Fe-S cluster biosynthesis and repair protein YggX